ncbi:unnamed protein product [Cuscuta campestris]|uniref:Chaperone DnaJ C-terminal domain-containing protein n=1 Tax=Cuscuta campestris TaxID=132261 RepID=A0A484M072_9ASTE|nr:unnamed protein product [Cuscuta campestris]
MEWALYWNYVLLFSAFEMAFEMAYHEMGEEQLKKLLLGTLDFVVKTVQALVGFEKTSKHLDDHLVDISSKGITKPKEVKKYKGEGMPLHFSNKKGDLYVTFEVLFPKSLTPDQKTKIKDILG